MIISQSFFIWPPTDQLAAMSKQSKQNIEFEDEIKKIKQTVDESNLFTYISDSPQWLTLEIKKEFIYGTKIKKNLTKTIKCAGFCQS